MDRIFAFLRHESARLRALLRRFGLAWLLLGTLVACQQQLPTVNQSSKPTVAGRADASDAITGLKEGAPYATLRKNAIGAGWSPMVDSACIRNVVGDDFKEACGNEPNSSACKICDHLPELSGCSGDAYCGMYFLKGGKRLHVVVYGDFSDWNNEAETSQFTVNGWDFSK